MSEFSNYIEKATGLSPELPTVHTTQIFNLDLIRKSNNLEPRLCPVFDEPLIYLFYGRPSYRDHKATTPLRDISFFPICFLFNPKVVLPKAKKMYPFDTGASKHGVYEPVIKFSGLSNFEMSTNILSAQKLVTSFFDNNENYVLNLSAQGLTFTTSEVAADSYYKLINGGGKPHCDDRSSSAEIQVAETIELNGALMAVVLPTFFLDDEDLRNTIFNIWRAQPITYDAVRGMRPLEFHGSIMQQICNFYRQQGLI